MAFTPKLGKKLNPDEIVQASPVQRQAYQESPAINQDLFGKITGAAQSFTNALGLKGATDVEGQNIADMIYPSLMARTNAPEPSLKQQIGAGLQIGAMTATPGAAELSVPAAASLGALQGATATGGQAASQNSSAGDIAKRAALGGAVGGAFAGATSLLGHVINGVGEKITSSSIKPSSADIQDGFDVANIQKYNVGGSLSTMYNKVDSKMSELTSQLNQKLADSNATINLDDVVNKTVNDLSGSKFKSFGSNTSIGTALQQLKNEVVNATGDTPDISIPDAQLAKQGAGRMGAWFYGAPDPESSARQTVYNTFYRNLKTAIEQNSPPGVRELNKQLSDLIPIQNAIIRRIPIAERNNALSLQDMMTLTAGILNPKALVGFGISLAQKEGAVGNLLQKFGPGVAKTAPAVGAGADTLLNAVLPPATKSQQLQAPVQPAQSSAQSSTGGDKFQEKVGMTEEQFKAKYDKYVQGAMGVGSLENAAAKLSPEVVAAFKGVHPSDVAYLIGFADHVKNTGELPAKSWELVQQIFKGAKLEIPKTQKATADFIHTVEESGFMKQMDSAAGLVKDTASVKTSGVRNWIRDNLGRFSNK